MYTTYFPLTQCASKKDHLRNMKITNFQNLFRDAWGCWLVDALWPSSSNSFKCKSQFIVENIYRLINKISWKYIAYLRSWSHFKNGFLKACLFCRSVNSLVFSVSCFDSPSSSYKEASKAILSLIWLSHILNIFSMHLPRLRICQYSMLLLRACLLTFLYCCWDLIYWS